MPGAAIAMSSAAMPATVLRQKELLVTRLASVSSSASVRQRGFRLLYRHPEEAFALKSPDIV